MKRAGGYQGSYLIGLIIIGVVALRDILFYQSNPFTVRKSQRTRHNHPWGVLKGSWVTTHLNKITSIATAKLGPLYHLRGDPLINTVMMGKKGMLNPNDS